MDHLIKAGILLRGEIPEKNASVYTPAVDINKLTIHYVLYKLEAEGLDDISNECDDISLSFNSLLSELSETVQKSDANKLLKDI